MNRIRHVLTRAAAASLLGICSAANGHHGWSGYHSEVQKLTGVIEESTYASPHGSIRLKSGDKAWLVVLAPPSRMTNRGLTAKLLRVGTSVLVEGYQHKTEADEMRRAHQGGRQDGRAALAAIVLWSWRPRPELNKRQN